MAEDDGVGEIGMLPSALLTRSAGALAAGDWQTAGALARTVAEQAADDVNLLHRAGELLRRAGAPEAALGVFARVLEILPDFHYSEIECGYANVDLGRDEEALRWFQKAKASAPGYPLTYLRLAQTLWRMGKPHSALAELEAGFAVDPTFREIATERVRALNYLGRREDAIAAYAVLEAAGSMQPDDWVGLLRLQTQNGHYDAVLQAAGPLDLPIDTSAGYHLAMLSGHARIASAYDREAVINVAAAREQSGQWRSAMLLALELRGAIDARRPYSLVRMGDGEGRFLAYCDANLRMTLTASEGQLLGDVAWRNWFGRGIESAAGPEIAFLYAAVMQAMDNADVLGVSTAERLSIDGLHFGYLAYLEGLFTVLQTRANPLRTTDAMAHIELHKLSPFYENLLGGLDFIGVVSPHPGLAERLAQLHGIGSFVEYLLPGESRLPADAQNRDAAPHFPDVYRKVLAELAVPRPGAVFLVAGGLLGKVYCDQVKRLGGIAIDVGSIVDAWMGYDTRDGQHGEGPNWVLPA